MTLCAMIRLRLPLAFIAVKLKQMRTKEKPK